VLAKLREQTGVLAELSPILGEPADLPEGFSHALRRAEVPLDEFEAAMGNKSINQVYREDRAVNRFEGASSWRAKMDQLEKKHIAMARSECTVHRAQSARSFWTRQYFRRCQRRNSSKSRRRSRNPIRRPGATSEHESGKTMRYTPFVIWQRAIPGSHPGFENRSAHEPAQRSDTLPLDPTSSTLSIFDEASQIPIEEASRRLSVTQVIIVATRCNCRLRPSRVQS